MALPQWNTNAFGCLLREEAQIVSLMRTVCTDALPAPIVTRTGDVSAPVQMGFGLQLSDAQFRSWSQWTTYDLNDGSLPFTMHIPWGTEQPLVRCRLIQSWVAHRINSQTWNVRGTMEIERESLPLWSGGAR